MTAESILDLAFKLGGAVCTFIVVPAVRWAIKVNSKLAMLTQDVQNVAEQIEEERAEALARLGLKPVQQEELP